VNTEKLMNKGDVCIYGEFFEGTKKFTQLVVFPKGENYPMSTLIDFMESFKTINNFDFMSLEIGLSEQEMFKVSRQQSASVVRIPVQIMNLLTK